MTRLLTAMVAVALPTIASGCPYCATAGGGGREGYVAGTLLLLLLPVGLVGVLVLWLRHAARPDGPEMT